MTAAPPLLAAGLTHAGEQGGLVLVALLVALVLAGVARVTPRATAVLTGGVLLLTPALLALTLWDNPKLATLHHHPLRGVAVLAAVLVVVAGLAFAIDRRDELLPLLAVAALPFRIPLGSVSSGLLLPLYAVVAAGALVSIWRAWRPSAGSAENGVACRPADHVAGRGPALMLSVVLILYALEALYSPQKGVVRAVENAGFFYVPFALLFDLLRRREWSPLLIRRCLVVLLCLAAVFVLVGFAELAAGGHLLLNRSLDQDAYFVRINSLFYDPNVYGRFLALTMIVTAAAMLFERPRRVVLAASAALALMWAGLLLSLSQSSMAALLAGLGVVALGAWGRRAASVAASVAALAVVGAIVYAAQSGNSANFLTSGRATLVSGGIDLFDARPLAGYGSGSFATEYLLHYPHKRSPFQIAKHLPYSPPTTSDSHTAPVTIAAEQGSIGLVAYVLLLVVCLRELFGAGLLRTRAGEEWLPRLAIGAAFVGLIVHTLLYADFLEDPATWVLLAVGGALAARARASGPATR